MNFDKKNIVGISVAVVAVAVVLIVVVSGLNKQRNGIPVKQAPGDLSSQTEKIVTREASPKDIVVPNKDSKIFPENVAKPSIVAPGSPTNNSSYRSFDIKAVNNEFTPNTIIVNEGDTMNINVTAVDKDYDFTQPDFGFKMVIKRGKTEKIQATFPVGASGKFTFYCASCGGPAKGSLGYIIVASRK